MTPTQSNGPDLRVADGPAKSISDNEAWIQAFRESLRDVMPPEVKELNSWIQDYCRATNDPTTGVPNPIPYFQSVIATHIERILDLAHEAFPTRITGDAGQLEIMSDEEIFHGLPWGDVMASIPGFKKRLQEFFLLSAALGKKTGEMVEGDGFRSLHTLDVDIRDEIIFQLFSDALEVVKSLRDHGFEGDAHSLAATSPVVVYDPSIVCLYIDTVAPPVGSPQEVFDKRNRNETRASLAITTKALERIPRPRRIQSPLPLETARRAQHPLANGKEKKTPETAHTPPTLRIVPNGSSKGGSRRRGKGKEPRSGHLVHGEAPAPARSRDHLQGLPTLN